MIDEAIRRVLGGDRDAFREIVCEYQDMAYSMAMSVVKDELMARDVVQHAFVREYDPRDVVDDQQQRQYYVNEALLRMPPNESLALRLFYLEEKSLREVSQITGWSVENTKVILHRARAKMRKVLGRHFKMNQ